MIKMSMLETILYDPVARFLLGRGYSGKALTLRNVIPSLGKNAL